MKKILIAGAIFACLSVVIGAFGAHALNPILANYKTTYETGVTYQMFHATALIFIGILLGKSNNRSLNFAAGLFIIGICLFSGSLYALSISKIAILGVITPFGGVAFITGWIFFMIGVAQPNILSKQEQK